MDYVGKQFGLLKGAVAIYKKDLDHIQCLPLSKLTF